MIIYKITNLLNGKRYIGLTTESLEQRLRRHACPANDCYLGRSIRKYGKENFKIEAVCRANNLDELNDREERLIKLYKTLKPSGYNVCLGGRNKHRMQSPMKGRKHSEETKKLMSKRAKGKSKSIETRLKMSKAKKGIKFSSEVVKQRASKSIGRNKLGKRIIDINTGIIYKSISLASIELKICRNTLTRWLKEQFKPNKHNANIKIAYYQGE